MVEHTDDPRVRAILTNPRLLGLPLAESFSVGMFIFLIVFNLIAAVSLSQYNAKIDNIPVNVLNTAELGSLPCEKFVIRKEFAAIDFVQGISDTDIFSIDAKVNDTQILNLNDTLVPQDIITAVYDICSETNFTFSLCLEDIEFAEILDEEEDVGSLFVEILRKPGDILFTLTFPNDVVYQIYHSNIVFGVPTQINVQLSKNGVSYELFLFGTKAGKEGIISSVTSFIEIFSTKEGQEEVLLYLYSPEATVCEQNSGLNIFQYFALLTDYSFIFEGFLAVGAAFTLLNCCNLVAAKRGRVIRANSAAELIKD